MPTKQPKAYPLRLNMAIPAVFREQIEYVQHQRTERLGFRDPAANVYREALTLGLRLLVDAEDEHEQAAGG